MLIEPPPTRSRPARAREPQVVWTTLVADLETPVSAFLKVAGGVAKNFLFESVKAATRAAAIRSSGSSRICLACARGSRGNQPFRAGERGRICALPRGARSTHCAR